MHSPEASPYSKSGNQLGGILTNLLNGSQAATPNVTFSNQSQWVQTNAIFSISTPFFLNESQVLAAIWKSKGNVSYAIVPPSLMVNNVTSQFDHFSIPLGLLNPPFTTGQGNKASADFQSLSKALEQSLKDTLGSQQLVEPVVNSFQNNSGSSIAYADLYFPPGATNEAAIRQAIVNNLSTFQSRNVTVDPLSVIPAVAVNISFTILNQFYTTDLSNGASGNANTFKNSVLSWIGGNFVNF
ncbi:uncharacterized protein LOC115075342 [Rhinatrema bivittatum]|uniref:uncharacterized protein LOC115075342 n=1 Tax=Rhinatrema bivittatum TaxID=194408 RepID=UPI0011293E5F|nr:uncharacterized protein LOC115075342 [Rhinatrema bivittatum]